MKHKNAIIICMTIIVIIALLSMIAYYTINWLLNKTKEVSPSITAYEQVDKHFLPSHLESIRNIGQWEFLSITDEEVVDTTRVNTFIDDHLVLIFHGTLRLGIDLQRIKNQDIVVQNDTVFMRLPQVELLDNNFIDDTRTTVFHETGKWSANERSQLYERGKRKMKQRVLTSQNLSHTQELAEEQIRRILHAMGYGSVIFTKPQEPLLQQ